MSTLERRDRSHPACLSIQPIRNLDQKGVRRMQGHQITEVASEVLEALLIGKTLAPFVPDDEKSRAWIVLPSEDEIRLKLLEVESARIARDRWIVEGREARVIVARAGR